MDSLVVNDHIRLEILRPSMAEEIFKAIDSDREYLKKWLPFVDLTLEVSDTEKFIQGLNEQKDTKRDEIYSIWVNEKFAGLVGFKDTDWINRKTEIGYWLIENLQGKGIITSCVYKLVKYSFEKLGLNRIQIKAAIGNTKSAAIPKRLGFQFEGIERAGELHNNNYFDLEVYSLIRSDKLN